VGGVYGIILFFVLLNRIDWNRTTWWFAALAAAVYGTIVAINLVWLVTFVAGMAKVSSSLGLMILIGVEVFYVAFIVAKPPLLKGDEQPECCRRGYCGTIRCTGVCRK
jgi:hypothetical protein